jgi:hypothetical protein
MASDVYLMIFDPRIGAMVRERWLGMGGVRDKAYEVLGNATTSIREGLECWADVAPEDMITIAKVSYQDGASPAEIRQYATDFPSPSYLWILLRDF